MNIPDQPEQPTQQPFPGTPRLPISSMRRFFPWIGAAIVLIILLIVVGVIEWPNLFGDGLSPEQVVQNYCQALSQHDYNRAVGYLDMPYLSIPNQNNQPGGVQNVPVSASALQQIDQDFSINQGVLKGCSNTKIFSSTSDFATVNTTATYNNPASGDSPFLFMIQLHKAGKNWRIGDAQLLY